MDQYEITVRTERIKPHIFTYESRKAALGFLHVEPRATLTGVPEQNNASD